MSKLSAKGIVIDSTKNNIQISLVSVESIQQYVAPAQVTIEKKEV